jgi:hypothetical protein
VTRERVRDWEQERFSNESHEELIKEIHRRECLDFDEEHVGQEEEESSDNKEDEEGEQSKTSDSSSSDNKQVQV